MMTSSSSRARGAHAAAWVLTTALLSAALVAGCGGATSEAEDDTSSALRYGRDARAAYERALLEFRQDDCLEADPIFRNVRRNYPYSRYAALAELRIADCKFNESEYAESIAAYRQFVRFRPSHTQVPYARFRIAASYYEQIPSEWLLSPPTHERDQNSTEQALRQLRRFILDYPDDENVAEARDMIAEALRLLAEHELYVARFYRSQDAHPAVVRRLQTLLSSYEGSGLEAEALLMLGETYLEMEEPDRARQAFEELVTRFPESDEAGDAQDELRELAVAPAPSGPSAEPGETPAEEES